MAKVRQAIVDDNLLEFRQDFIEKYGYKSSKKEILNNLFSQYMIVLLYFQKPY